MYPNGNHNEAFLLYIKIFKFFCKKICNIFEKMTYINRTVKKYAVNCCKVRKRSFLYCANGKLKKYAAQAPYNIPLIFYSLGW